MSKLIPVITLLSRLLEIPRGKRSRAYPSVTQGNSTQLSSRGLARHLLCKMSPKEVVKVHHLLRSVIKLESLVVYTVCAHAHFVPEVKLASQYP